MPSGEYIHDASTRRGLAADRRVRDQDIYRRYARGQTVDAIAAEYGLSSSGVRYIVSKVRNAVPRLNSEELRTDLKAQLDELRSQMHAIVDLEPDKKITTKIDPNTGESVVEIEEDHSARIQAAKVVILAQARMAKMLGTDSPEQTVTSSTVTYELVGVDPDVV